MNRDEIMTFLPHRGPMLLLDTVEMTGENTAVGAYTARGDEWFFNGHFPGNPVMPGVVQCEMMAQAASILMREALNGKTPLYAAMNNVRFRHQVKPGDTLRLETRLLRQKMNVYIVAGEAYVGDSLCASGELTFMLV